MSKQNNNNKHLRAHINKQANKRKKQNKQTKESTTTTKIIHLLSGARTCDFGLFPYTCVTGVNTKPYHI